MHNERRRRANEFSDFELHRRFCIGLMACSAASLAVGSKQADIPMNLSRPSLTKMSYRTDDQRWRAVQQRDKAANGAFIYGVATTGVYCRPDCTSRQPNRENVRFFEQQSAATAAGYRACKRCQPDKTASVHPHSETVMAACRTIESAESPPSLEALAKRANLSPGHFQRVFKSLIGLTPKQYEKAYREQSLRRNLAVAKNITYSIHDAGYQSSAQLYRDTHATLGMTPSQRIAGAPGELIEFAVGECSLGNVLVAASENGVCAIALGDDPQELVEQLQRDFSDAELLPGQNAFENRVANVVGIIDEPERTHDIALDIRGTAFQKKVWEALLAIRPGQTVNYSDIAAAIGRPKSVRAVANACGSNRLAVAIPCHRVIRSDGSIAGYRWGVERKQALLKREAKADF